MTSALHGQPLVPSTQRARSLPPFASRPLAAFVRAHVHRSVVCLLRSPNTLHSLMFVCLRLHVSGWLVQAMMQMQRPVPTPPPWDLDAVEAARAEQERAAAAGEVVMPPLDPTWHRIVSQKVRSCVRACVRACVLACLPVCRGRIVARRRQDGWVTISTPPPPCDGD